MLMPKLPARRLSNVADEIDVVAATHEVGIMDIPRSLEQIRIGVPIESGSVLHAFVSNHELMSAALNLSRSAGATESASGLLALAPIHELISAALNTSRSAGAIEHGSGFFWLDLNCELRSAALET